jgi:hypothetical protein
MLSKRCRLPLMLTSALLCTTPVFAANDTFTLNPGTSPTDGVENTLSWSDKSAGKNLKKVVLPEYSIEFLIDNSASSAAGKTSVAMTWQLKGVGPAEFQAITDAAHDNLRQSLAAAGFEVVGAEEMSAHPAYAKMRAQGKESGTATASGVVMAPSGMVVMPLGTLSNRDSGGALSALKGLRTVGSAIAGAFDSNEMAQGMNATVLQVHVAVDFSQVEGKRGLGQRLSGEAKVEGNAQPSIAATSTSMRLLTPEQKGGQLTLEKALLLPQDTFSGSEEATRTSTRVGDAAGALLRFGAGVGGSSQTKEYVVTAEPAQYKLRMSEGLAQLNAAIVARLVKAR